MANIVNIKKLNHIRDNYPDVWEWMKDKAKWEGMCLGYVLHHWEERIDEMINQKRI